MKSTLETMWTNGSKILSLYPVYTMSLYHDEVSPAPSAQRFFSCNQNFLQSNLSDLNIFFTLRLFCYFFIFFFCFMGLHLWHMEVPWLGVTSELQLLATTTAIWTASSTYTTVRGKARPFNPLRTGMEPTSSWILVGFDTTETWQELPEIISLLLFCPLLCVIVLLLNFLVNSMIYHHLFFLFLNSYKDYELWPPITR